MSKMSAQLKELSRQYNAVSIQLWSEESKVVKPSHQNKKATQKLIEHYRTKQIEIDDQRTKIYLRSIDK